VFGDGSLPFEFGVSGKLMRLIWLNGRGIVEGERGEYNVYAWKQMG
jgi:hypothetical protein